MRGEYPLLLCNYVGRASIAGTITVKRMWMQTATRGHFGVGGVKTPGLVSLFSDPRRGHPPTAQTPFPPTPNPLNFFDFSKSLENSKNFPDYREYSKYYEYRVNSSIL
jgi:hypothetical protein